MIISRNALETSGAIKNRDANDQRLFFKSNGFEVVKADDTQIHAKFACWDKSNVVISSLYWLSVSSKGNDFGELGVHLVGGDFSIKLQVAFNRFYER